jgi:sugar phosphate isomerase/epimerase
MKTGLGVASISTSIFKKRTLSECVQPLAEAGFKYLEIGRGTAGWGDAAPAIGDAGLRVWAVHGRAAFKVLLDSPDEAECRAAIDSERRAMEEVACYAPCAYVLHYQRVAPPSEYEDRFRRRLEELLRTCEGFGLTLALEMLQSKPEIVRHVGDSAEVAQIVRSYVGRRLCVCLDFNHSNIGEDLLTVARNCAGLIGTVHISDNYGVREQHLPPGEGVIDWPRSIRALRAAGYSGPLNLEVNVEGEPSIELLIRLRRWAEDMNGVCRQAKD